MKKKVYLLFASMMLVLGGIQAQEEQGRDSQQPAQSAGAKVKSGVAGSRYAYIRAFEDCFRKGQLREGVENGVKATALYYKENLYKESFDLLRRIDQTINAAKPGESESAALHYLTTKERLQMYMRLRKGASAAEQLKVMEALARAAANESVSNDLLYTKAVYYYTFGHNEQGNAVFKEMANKLTAQKEYGKVDEVYRTLIANGRKSGSANLVAQSYSGYMAWKDSVNALKAADTISALHQQIADRETTIAEKDSKLSTRQWLIVALCVLAAALACALVAGALILMRFILLTRKQKKTITTANENNALKAQFISNISAQLEPTLKRLDSSQPEVKALLDFSSHIQTLSELENAPDEVVELEDTPVQPFCESLMDGIRDKVKSGVKLTVNAPALNVMINKEYVSHILSHLLENAAEYAPEGGKINLEYRKRSVHKQQFLVSDNGQGIPTEKCEDVFKPFLEIRDLTTGDGLGLPICKQMAMKMDGDLEIDPEYTKGTRFVLNLKM